MMNSVTSSDETKESQTTPRGCWDYSAKEIREMPSDQAGQIISQRIQDNVRRAREKAEAEAKTNSEAAQ
jgi:hypothetical protein